MMFVATELSDDLSDPTGLNDWTQNNGWEALFKSLEDRLRVRNIVPFI